MTDSANSDAGNRGQLSEDLSNVVKRMPQLVSRRDQQIVEHLWGLRSGRSVTLEEVGAILGLTRERVRQLRNRAVPRIARAIRGSPTPFVAECKLVIAASGGLWDRLDAGAHFVSRYAADDYDPVSYLWMLVEWEVFQDTSLFEGNLVVAAPVTPAVLAICRRVVADALHRQNAVLLAELSSEIAVACPGLPEESHDQLARHLASREGAQVLPGMFARNRWHRTEYAEFVLEQTGAPLHFSEIAARISALTGDDVNPTGLNSLLNSEPRFVRVGAGDFALSRWGATRYGRFDEVLQRYLASGRIAEHVSRMERDLLTQYTVASSTLRVMLSWNRETFEHFGGGHWGLRGYEAICDAELVRRVEEVLRAAGSFLTASTVASRVAVAPDRLATHLEEVTRVLFLHPRLRRAGKGSTLRFQL